MNDNKKDNTVFHPNPKDRNNFMRCKICKRLYAISECILIAGEEKGQYKGYQCPRGCTPQFVQPPYEPPTQYD